MRFLFVPACLLFGLFPSCTCRGAPSGSADETPTAESASASAAPSAPVDPRLTGRPPRHGGFAGLVLRSARESATTPEQKASVLKIEQDLHEAEPPFAPLKDYQEHLADAIKAGQISVAKLAPDFAAIDQVEVDREEKQAEALNAIHAALDAPARTALVGLARTRLTAMFRTRPDLAMVDGGDSGEPPWVKHRVVRLGGDVGLDAAQKAKVGPILTRASLPPAVLDARKEAARKHADALLDAFAQDDFDAKKVDLTAEGAHKPAHEALEHEAVLIGQVLPILTPDQREKLAAQKLRRVGHWLEEPLPWSPFEDSDLVPGQPRLR
jgi:Spy/CpxP family protein refolding chaperone